MREIEKLFHEQIESENFQKAVSDDFSFVDNLIDNRDIEKFKEDHE